MHQCLNILRDSIMMMRTLFASVFLFRLFGVPVRAHFSWLIFVTGFIILDSRGQSNPLLRVLEIGFVLFMLFGSLLAHEFAHVLVARRNGCRVTRIVILPIGCFVQLDEPPHAPYELWMALAGPLASVALSVASGLCLILLDWQFRFGYIRMRALLMVLCEFNIIVAAFNLIPCFPMDGGRILRSLLVRIIRRIAPHRKTDATYIATIVSVRCVAWPIAIATIAVTCIHAEIWIQTVIFSLMILAGEAELWLLRNPENADPVEIANVLPLSMAPGGEQG